MNLSVPGATLTPGPEYAVLINGDLDIIDVHDHTTGKGVAIPSGGININADLQFNSFNATLLRSTRFVAQGSPLALATDLGCVYVSGVDLYYNDVNGNQVRITQSGGVAGSPGSISGLSSPASATYNSGTQTFVWQSNTSIAANMDFGSAVLRNLSPNSTFGLTLSPPVLGSNYTITLPSLPVATSFMQMDTSGNVSAVVPLANGITRSMQAAVGQQVSATTGITAWNASGSISVYQTVGSLSVSLTTTGRPVILGMQCSGSGSFSGFISVTASSGQNASIMDLQYLRGSTALGPVTTFYTGSINQPPSCYNYLDVIGAGTYTYTVQVKSQISCPIQFTNVTLYAYEL